MTQTAKLIGSVVAVLLFVFVLSAPSSAASSEADLTKVYVLDTETQSVTSLDAATGRVLATAAVKAKHEGYIPTLELMNRDGSRLIVIDPGSSKITFRFGFHPTEKSVATIIDTSSFEVMSRLELGWNFGGHFLSPDGKILAAICSGYQSQKPEETRPRELVVVNLQTGQLVNRVALPRPVRAWAGSEDGHTLALFFERVSEKKAPVVPAELRFYNLDDAKFLGTLALEGAPEAPIASPDGDYLYLLELGEPSNNPEKNINGRIHVVSFAGRALETILDAGSDPRGLIVDEEQVMVLSNGVPAKDVKNPDGELRIIKGAAVANTIKVSTSPEFLRMSPDRKRMYVAGGGFLTAVRLQQPPEVAWRMPLEAAGGGVVSGGIFDSHPVDEFAQSPDGTRGFALYQGSSKLSIVNLENPGVIASVTTGRGGMKFAKFLGSMALTAASATVAYGQASNMAMSTGGYGYAPYHVYSVAQADTCVAVRPDGRFVYVLNSQTNDVTIVDTEKALAGEKIAVGGRRFPPASGRRLHLLEGGRILAVVSDSSLHLIDTATQKELPEILCGKSLDDFSASSGGRFAVAFGENSLILLDGSTGRALARPAGFKKPSRALFSSPALAAQSQPAVASGAEEAESF